jgi:hypothetical protein
MVGFLAPAAASRLNVQAAGGSQFIAKLQDIVGLYLDPPDMTLSWFAKSPSAASHA